MIDDKGTSRSQMPLRLEKVEQIPRGIPGPPCRDHEPDRCCGNCASWWTAQICGLPTRQGNPVVIQDERHAHTAGMRLANLADLIERNPTKVDAELAALLGDEPETRRQVVEALRRAARDVRGV